MTEAEKKKRGFGKYNSNWKSSVKARAKHYRIEAKRGKAREHKCTVCGAQAEEWAEVRRGVFEPQCKSCHSKFHDRQNNIFKNKLSKIKGKGG